MEVGFEGKTREEPDKLAMADNVQASRQNRGIGD